MFLWTCICIYPIKFLICTFQAILQRGVLKHGLVMQGGGRDEWCVLVKVLKGRVHSIHSSSQFSVADKLFGVRSTYCNSVPFFITPRVTFYDCHCVFQHEVLKVPVHSSHSSSQVLIHVRGLKFPCITQLWLLVTTCSDSIFHSSHKAHLHEYALMLTHIHVHNVN